MVTKSEQRFYPLVCQDDPGRFTPWDHLPHSGVKSFTPRLHSGNVPLLTMYTKHPWECLGIGVATPWDDCLYDKSNDTIVRARAYRVFPDLVFWD